MYANTGKHHQETTREKTILKTQPKKTLLVVHGHFWLLVVAYKPQLTTMFANEFIFNL